MIRGTDLTVRIGGRAILEGADLDVPDGSVTAIVGPNGSGKSTLLRCLVRATRLSRGRVEIDGTEVRRLSRRRIAQQVAYVGQHPDGDPALTVADEVALGTLARRRVADAPAHDAVADALVAVDLAHRAGSLIATLSGGERQRVALARAMVQAATHVLLDEPTNHLDPRHRLEVLELLPAVAPTAVVVVHDLDLAARYADHVVVLDRGAVAAAGTPSAVLVPEVLDRVYGVRSHVTPAAPGLPASARHIAFALPGPAIGPPLTESTPPLHREPLPERASS